jgi:hypothetical protein
VADGPIDDGHDHGQIHQFITGSVELMRELVDVAEAAC